MSIPDFFLTQLKIKSGIPLIREDAGTEFQPLYEEGTLQYILDEASQMHSGVPFMSNLDNAPYVFLLARKEVYTILAGMFAKSYDIGSRDGNLKKSQPYDHYLKLIKQVEDTYLRLTKGSQVKVTPVLLSNRTRYVYRNHLNAPDPVATIHIEDNTDEYVSFRLSSGSSTGIVSFDIYLSDEPIYDMFESPPISPTSTLIQRTTPYTHNTYRVPKNGLMPEYIGILTKNRYGRHYFLEHAIGDSHA